MTGNVPDSEFVKLHLPVEFDLPESGEGLLFPDVFVELNIDLVAPGDGVVTDRHYASSGRYEPDDAMNQIGGQLSPFALSGWLRHGCEEVLQEAGTTACHPGEQDAGFARENVYERDLDSGYHEKGSCAEDYECGCVVYELFGGFGDRPGELLRRPVSFSPVRSNVDVLKGEAEAHYRQLSSQVRSRNDEDGGKPLRHSTRDVLGNLEGTWKLSLRELKPELVGLLVEAVSLLDARSGEFAFQLGGARNFGGGVVDVSVLNPLYSEAEVRRVFNRAQAPSQAMEEKDEAWRSEFRPRFVEALQARIAGRDGDADVSVLSGEAGTSGGESV
jgi:hypothetical protein